MERTESWAAQRRASLDGERNDLDNHVYESVVEKVGRAWVERC